VIELMTLSLTKETKALFSHIGRITVAFLVAPLRPIRDGKTPEVCARRSSKGSFPLPPPR